MRNIKNSHEEMNLGVMGVMGGMGIMGGGIAPITPEPFVKPTVLNILATFVISSPITPRTPMAPMAPMALVAHPRTGCLALCPAPHNST